MSTEKAREMIEANDLHGAMRALCDVVDAAEETIADAVLGDQGDGDAAEEITTG